MLHDRCETIRKVACVQQAIKQSDDVEKRSMTCFRTFVGIGSAADDLPGSRRTSLMTSPIVSGKKAAKDTPQRRRLKAGGGMSFVCVCTFSTFPRKIGWMSQRTHARPLPRPKAKTQNSFNMSAAVHHAYSLYTLAVAVLETAPAKLSELGSTFKSTSQQFRLATLTSEPWVPRRAQLTKELTRRKTLIE